MQTTRIFDKQGTVHYSKNLDYGGMFKGTEGVFESEGKFYAFVKDGWGAGGYSKGHPDQQTAIADIVRLRKRYFG